MNNKSILVGKIKSINFRNKNNSIPRLNIEIEISRSYKNDKGEYDVDIVNIVYENEEAVNYSKLEKGTSIGIKCNIIDKKLIAESISILN